MFFLRFHYTILKLLLFLFGSHHFNTYRAFKKIAPAVDKSMLGNTFLKKINSIPQRIHKMKGGYNMAVADKFSGLDMKNLIGGPLSAADASVQLAQSTADFINSVGFDESGKVRNMDFGYEKRVNNDDGTVDLQEMKIQVPMIAITPIPNLQVDSVNVTIGMEVKESEQSESSTDVSAAD